MLFLMVFPAMALTIVAPCLPLSIDASVPTAGAVDVPTDTVLSVGVSTCEGGDGVVMELRSAAGEVLRGASFDAPDAAAVYSLDPEGLAQNTDYVLVARGETTGVEMQAPFTTGGGAVFGLSGVPEIISTDAYAEWNRVELSAGYPVVTATDPDVLSIATLHDGDDVVGVAPIAVSGEQVWLGFQATPEDRPKEVCVVPGQVDGRGTETLGDEVCLKVTGCATVPGRTLGAAAALAGLLLGLRRRGTRQQSITGA